MFKYFVKCEFMYTKSRLLSTNCGLVILAIGIFLSESNIAYGKCPDQYNLDIDINSVFRISDEKTIYFTLIDKSGGEFDFASTPLDYELRGYETTDYVGRPLVRREATTGVTRYVEFQEGWGGVTEIIIKEHPKPDPILGTYRLNLQQLFGLGAGNSHRGLDSNYYILRVLCSGEDAIHEIANAKFSVYVAGELDIDYLVSIMTSTESIRRKEWARRYLEDLTGRPIWRLTEGDLAGDENAQRAAIEEYKWWWEHNKSDYQPLEYPLIVTEEEFTHLSTSSVPDDVAVEGETE